MANEVRYLISQEQLKTYTVIQKTLEGSMTVREAAEVLDLSARQVIRLRKFMIFSPMQVLKALRSADVVNPIGAAREGLMRVF